MSITVRDATAADAATLIGYLRDLQEWERALCPSRRPGQEVDRLCYEHLLQVGADLLLALDGDRPIGFVAGRLRVDEDELMTPAWRWHGYVSDLFVAPAQRGRGVGQLLLQAMADRLRSKGAARLRIGSLCVNQAALAAYRRFGFEPFEVVLDLDLAQR
jgi:ribosomal protein S18 acetylase RimI-like enzyme